MTDPDHEQFEITRRQERVADLYLQGFTQKQIAVRLVVHQSTISRDLAHVRAEWKASRIRDFDELQTIEIEKIDRVEREAWAAWERSKLDLRKRSKTTGEDGGAVIKREVIRRDGDPRFLAIVERCIERRCALMGLDEATTAAPPIDGPERAAARAEHSVLVNRLRNLQSGAGEN